MGLAGSVFLITGGTGSFGNAAAKRLLAEGAAEVRVLSRDEKKQDDMRRAYADPRLRFFVGDVRDGRSLEEAVDGVRYVFHAAALKQVPSCEFHPLQALQTNSLGAENVLRAAQRAGVEKAIVLSTDKAVYPINAMGLTKALMEKIMAARARSAAAHGTVLCGTRYGNVMASRGSVIPVLIDQIRQGLPLTLTDPSMTRFMMSLENAVELVLYAFEHGQPGDILVQKAPAATLDTLAWALKGLFSAHNPVRVIGTRHGEKLYETLLTREEMARAEDLGEYYCIPSDSRDLNYETYMSMGSPAVGAALDYNSHNTHRLDVTELTELLLTLSFVQEQLRDWRGRA